MDVKRWWCQYRNESDIQSLFSLHFAVLHPIFFVLTKFGKCECSFLFQWIKLTLFHILSSLFPYFCHQIQRILSTEEEKKLGCISIFRNQKYANTIYHGCVCAHIKYVRKILLLLLLLLKQNIWPMPKELSKYSMLEMCFDIFTLYKGLETSISIVYIWCEKCSCTLHLLPASVW